MTRWLEARPRLHLALVVALVVGIAGFAIALGDRHSRRLDLTPTHALSLSGLSRAVLARLSGTVEATAFASRESAAAVADVLSLFHAADPRFRAVVADLDREPARAREHGVDRYDRVELRAGDRRIVVAADRETAITAGLVRLLRGRAARVAFLTGHGERALDDAIHPTGYGLARQALVDEGYEVTSVSLLRGEDLPQTTDAVIFAGPSGDLLDAEAAALEALLARGGHLVVLVDPGSLPNLTALCARHGIALRNATVVDRTNQLFGSEDRTVAVPTYRAHAMNAAARTPALFSGARPVGIEREEGAARELLASYPEAFALRDAGHLRSAAPGPEGAAVQGGPIPLGAASSWPATGHEARLTVIGDADFASNGLLDLLGNRDLLLNAVAWSVAESELVAERPHAEPSALRPISPLALSRRAAGWIFVAAVLVEPGLVLALGAVVALRARRRAAGA